MKRHRQHRRPLAVLGVAWFQSDQWDLLRSLASDPEKLEESHASWEAIAIKAIKDLSQRGLTLRRVEMDVEELYAWCIAEQRPLDAAARADYATYLMRSDAASD